VKDVVEMKYRAIVFDVDGVLVEVDSIWRYIHRRLGTLDKAIKYAEMFHRGQISYEEWAYLDARLWRGIKKSTFKSIVSQIPFKRGARELVEQLKSLGLKIIAISAGLDILTKRVVEELGIDSAVSNEMIFEDDVFTGVVKVHVTYNNKGEVMREVLSSLGVDTRESIAVGDSEVDIPMFSVAGLAIAFNPKSPEVIYQADITVIGELYTLQKVVQKVL